MKLESVGGEQFEIPDRWDSDGVLSLAVGPWLTSLTHKQVQRLRDHLSMLLGDAPITPRADGVLVDRPNELFALPEPTVTDDVSIDDRLKAMKAAEEMIDRLAPKTNDRGYPSNAAKLSERVEAIRALTATLLGETS